jgi:hypothetical protein
MRIFACSLFAVWWLTRFPSLHAAPASWQVASPDGKVAVTVRLTKPGDRDHYPNRPRLYYQVEHGSAEERTVIIRASPLGLLLADDDFLDGLRVESAQGPTRVEENYTLLRGKRHRRFNAGTATTVRFRNRKGAALELDLRAYDDGIAFRYRIPGESNQIRTLQTELTGFSLPADARLWVQPSDKVTSYAPAYETYYENGIPVGTPSPTGMGWAFPLLFCTPDQARWALITEANLGTNYFGARLSSTATNGLYRISAPDPTEGRAYGATQPASALPWEMPWRVVIVGDNPGAMVESTLVEDLSAPSRLSDSSWIKPGRVAWSWWSDQDSPKDGVKQKRFIDFAAEMGWEYVLVDANWSIMDNGNIHEVIRYAKDKGVGVLLWYNTGGPNNVVTEKPRDCLFYPQVRRFELQLLRDWGVKGIKVDFFQSDKPDMIALYQDILKATANSQIMVNFHGCTLPRGWTRTWPHLMSMEAAQGEECYLSDSRFPDRAPVQNTITPFTRNAVGPMDYTPMGLTSTKYPRKTSAAHELALTTLFESGWVHFADDPDVYRHLPDEPKGFIKELPVAWDDTRWLAGYPGRDIVLARRKGDSWYLAGVNGRNEGSVLNLDLKRVLGTGQWDMTIIADGADPQHFTSRTGVYTAGRTLPVPVLPYGGFVGTFKAKRP